MFHVAKVLEVLSPSDKGAKSSDGATHALLEMWDENLLIFRSDRAIAGALKEGIHVLVDYSPVAVGGAPVPRHEIVSIVSEAKAKKIISKLKASLEEKKKPRREPNDGGFMVPGKMIG